MTDLAFRNRQARGAFGKPTGRASIVLFAAIAILGISTVSGSLFYQWQRSGAVREAWGDLAAEQQAKAELEELGFLTTHNLHTGHVEYVSFLECGDLDEVALQRLTALPHLVALDLRSCNITDQRLQYVSSLAEMSCLQLDNNPVTDKGLTHLGRLRELRQVFLRGTKVSNKGLPLVAHLPELNTLDLRDTPVTEQGLKHLRDMRKLRWVLLTEITDAGVPLLLEMQGLERLYVVRNRMSEEELRRLKVALPGLTIEAFP